MAPQEYLFLLVEDTSTLCKFLFANNDQKEKDTGKINFLLKYFAYSSKKNSAFGANLQVAESGATLQCRIRNTDVL